MKSIILKALYFVMGSIFSAALIFFYLKLDLHDYLSIFNSKYAAFFNSIFSFALVLITLIYVFITYRQVVASNKSVVLSSNFLKQTEEQFKRSKIPVLSMEIVDTNGSPNFANNRRQLNIYLKITNIGDTPAIKIYAKINITYTHVEFEDYDQLKEFVFFGDLGVNCKKDEVMTFESEKIEKMIEDLSIGYIKNTHRLKNDPNRRPYKGPNLVIEIVYSNIHNQFFKTTLNSQILNIDVESREENKHIYWFTDDPLKDDEQFKLGLINPIYNKLDFEFIHEEQENSFAERYEGCR